MSTKTASVPEKRLPRWKSLPYAAWVGVIMFVVAYITWFLFMEVFTLHGSNQANRDALTNIHATLQRGDTHATVLKKYWQDRTAELRISTDSPARWEIGMPKEFGAGDWSLEIDFDEVTGKVTAIRVRTSDGPAPKDGPPDK